MMIALILFVFVLVLGDGGRVVTRAKKFMSVFMRGQGSVPDWPMPSFGVEDEGVVRMGVVATIRVRGERGCGC